MSTYKTGADLIAEAKARITEITPKDAIAAHAAEPAPVFLDVREPNEWNLGHVPNAVHIPRGQLEGKVEGLIDRSANVIIYCASGNRSALAADTMRTMGYNTVSSLAAGFRGWAESGGDIED
jgi:rhodanese-related sulfurtransferase